VYDDSVHQCVDYDVPTAHHTAQRTENSSVVTTADSLLSQDYDVPTGVPPMLGSCHNNDDDVDFGVGDYDLLSPPPPSQRPASDVDASVSSNRSSVTSVMSGGSLSSGCASVRSAQSPSNCVGVSPTTAGARMNGWGPHLAEQAAPRRCLSETTSDSSADSGIALQSVLNSPLKNGTLTVNGADDMDCLDYDVPVANADGAERPCLEVVEERRSATPQRRCSPSIEHISPVIMDELRRLDDGRCVVDVRRRRVEELRDCVMRNVQRFLAWTGRATGDAHPDVAAARQCYGQAKLAGLAVRTSLKELVAVVDGNPPELLHHHIDPLNQSLFEIDRRLDCLIASGSEGTYPHRLSGSTSGGRHAARDSPACRDRLQALAEVVADLPELVRRFAVFVATNSAVVVQPPEDIEAIQSPPPPSYVHRKVQLPPVPPQRKDSHQRDKPPQSPPAVAGTNPRARRPPIGKPPPVKPKPPKSVTWKRPPQTPAPLRPAVSPAATTTNGTVSRANSARLERRVAELNKKNVATSDGWNEDDCDYVSIVREVEREMESMSKPAAKNSMHPRTSSPLSDDDRELLEFYAAQISAHAADVDAASAEFYRCWPSSMSSPSVDLFVRRSRFVVLAAHRLVYVGDVIARHMTDRAVGDRVAAAANELCNELKMVVMATRDAAVATADNENAAAVAGARQTMMDSVGRATDDCRRLCEIISAIACQ